MSLWEIVSGGGEALLVLLTVVEIVPVKINPWSALARCLGKAFNADVLKELAEVKRVQDQQRVRLEEHIRVDNERDADSHRAKILQFNTDLLRNHRHTKEDFNEVLYDIDCYERYCEKHSDYQNNRAVHAIAHIKRVYDELMETQDFL